MTVTAGDYYRVDEPEWATTYGQGDPPSGCVFVVDGERFELKWGEEYQASDRTTNLSEYAPGKVKAPFLQQLADNDQLTKTS